MRRRLIGPAASIRHAFIDGRQREQTSLSCMFPQQCLNSLPLQHGQGSFRTALPKASRRFDSSTTRLTFAGGLFEASSPAIDRMYGSMSQKNIL
jgi:hypothetical protein